MKRKELSRNASEMGKALVNRCRPSKPRELFQISDEVWKTHLSALQKGNLEDAYNAVSVYQALALAFHLRDSLRYPEFEIQAREVSRRLHIAPLRRRECLSELSVLWDKEKRRLMAPSLAQNSPLIPKKTNNFKASPGLFSPLAPIGSYEPYGVTGATGISDHTFNRQPSYGQPLFYDRLLSADTEEYIEKEGKYRVKRVTGDGNCAFRAVAQGMSQPKARLNFSDETTEALDLRKLVAQKLVEYQDREIASGLTIKQRLDATEDRSFEDYVDGMSKKNYAGETELWILAHELGVRISIFTKRNDDYKHLVSFLPPKKIISPKLNATADSERLKRTDTMRTGASGSSNYDGQTIRLLWTQGTVEAGNHYDLLL